MICYLLIEVHLSFALYDHNNLDTKILCLKAVITKEMSSRVKTLDQI